MKALAHPTRVAIIVKFGRDTNRKMSPVELAELLNVPLGTVAYHVRTLRDLGVLKPAGSAQRRGATEHYYRLESERIFDAAQVIQRANERAQRIVARAYKYAEKVAA